MPVTHKEGQQLLKRAYKKNKLSQEMWAQQSFCSVATIKGILGTPLRSVSQDTLEKACEVVDVNWREVVDCCDVQLTEVRQKYGEYLSRHHGQIKCLDMSQSIGLDDVFIEVNVLEKLTGSLRLGQQELIQQANQEDFERLGFGGIQEPGLPGLKALERFQQLVVLGKPGSGKTTFLCRVAILNLHKQFLPDYVSVFVRLSDFAAEPDRPSLLDYIIRHWESKGIDPETTQQLLKQGRVLVLLDGLDEVKEADSQRVVRSVERFTEQFFTNYFALTCRIAAREYTFSSFTEVEVADFKLPQIQNFADKWFNSRDTRKSAAEFMKHLEANPRILQLATSPLLLTLLCLVFEDSGRFMESRADLYKQGIELLLFKWDSKQHNLQREQVYRGLNTRRIQELLGEIAKATFERDERFFGERKLESWISDFIRNLPEAQTDMEALRVESSRVLKSIAERGLLIERAQTYWSFSHLTFHEYFIAQAIVTNCNPRSIDDPVLHQLANHITKHQWREVFLLVVELLPDASCLLQIIKQKVDSLVENQEILQEMLNCLYQKSCSVNTKYKAAGVRAFYLEVIMDNYGGQICAIDKSLDWDLSIDNVLNRLLSKLLYEINLKQDSCRGLAICLDRIIEPLLEVDLPLVIDSSEARDRFDLWQAAEPSKDVTTWLSIAIEKADATLQDNQYFKQALEQFQAEFNKKLAQQEDFECFNSETTKELSEKVRQIIIDYRGFGFDWQGKSTPNQRELLKSYYNANELLANCFFKTNCFVSSQVRQEIEDTLLLPIAEINSRHSKT